MAGPELMRVVEMWGTSGAGNDEYCVLVELRGRRSSGQDETATIWLRGHGEAEMTACGGEKPIAPAHAALAYR